MGFPIGDLFSMRSFLLTGAQACQLFENDLMDACNRLQFIARILHLLSILISNTI